MTCTTMTAEIMISKNGFFGIAIRTNNIGVRMYEDVTRDIASLEKLAKLINAGQVSQIHIDELIDDIIG